MSLEELVAGYLILAAIVIHILHCVPRSRSSHGFTPPAFLEKEIEEPSAGAYGYIGLEKPSTPKEPL